VYCFVSAPGMTVAELEFETRIPVDPHAFLNRLEDVVTSCWVQVDIGGTGVDHTRASRSQPHAGVPDLLDTFKRPRTNHRSPKPCNGSARLGSVLPLK
jgi:hypothetical protein